MSRLMQLAGQAKILSASDRLLWRYVDSWVADKGYDFVEMILKDPRSRGKDIFYLHRVHFYDPNPQKPRQEQTKSARCGDCHDSGLCAGGVKDGKVYLVPCEKCLRRRIP